MEEEVASQIRRRIRGPVALVGIGNPLRGDDGLGPKLIDTLKGAVAANLFDCGTAPENYIIPILNANPGSLVFLDAADFGSTPGAIGVFDMSEVSGISFSTHNTSPRLLADLFKTGDARLNIFMVVVQPKSISFGEGLSEEAKAAIERLKRIFSSILSANGTQVR